MNDFKLKEPQGLGDFFWIVFLIIIVGFFLSLM